MSEGEADEEGGAAVPVAGVIEESEAPASGSTDSEAQPQQSAGTEGRRTQLRIVRENIGILSQDIGTFRRNHDANIKRLEKQVASLRSELAASKLSKDVASLSKRHDASSKRLEKQVTTLRNELAALKANIAKDAARTRTRQEVTLGKILSKVSAKPKAVKSSKKKK